MIAAGAHRHLPQARCADDLFVHSKHELDVTATEDQLVRGIKNTLAVSTFPSKRMRQSEPDIRVWGLRFDYLMASIVAGCLI